MTMFAEYEVSQGDPWGNSVDQQHEARVNALLAEVSDLTSRLEVAQSTLRFNESWKDQLVRDAHEYANENSLCSEFDRFMEAHDLPRRVRDYQVAVTAQLTVYINVSANDSDDAMANVSTSEVIDAIRDGYIPSMLGNWDADYASAL